VKKNGDQKLYIDYMSKFHKSCIDQRSFTVDCSNSVLQSIDVNLLDEINECYKGSFKYNPLMYSSIFDITENCSSNIYLDESEKYLNKHLKRGLPFISINNNIFMGHGNLKMLSKQYVKILMRNLIYAMIFTENQ